MKKQLLWMGAFFLSVSWLFYLPIFAPSEYIIGSCFLFLGLACNIIGAIKQDEETFSRKYLFVFIPLLIGIGLIEFPFSIGIIILLLGLVIASIALLRPRYKKIMIVWPGFFFSSILLLIQAFLFPVYVKFAARFHETDIFSSVISTFGSWLGFNTTYSGDKLFVGAINGNPAIIISWESIGTYILVYVFIGAVLLHIFFTSRKKIGVNLLMFFGIGIVYVLARYLVFLSVLVEISQLKADVLTPSFLNMFYDPIITFVSFIPLILLYMRFIPLQKIEFNNFRSKTTLSKRKHIASLLLVFLSIFLLVSSYGFQDPGIVKQRRVLIDEKHSQWESSLRPMDMDWYGQLSTYNYYSLAEWLKHYYTIYQNVNESLTPALLSNYDICILKCPTEPYSDTEVATLVRFVRNGGGLYCIGDHTNVFGMNSYLNKVVRNFGVEYNKDATHELTRLGGFSVYIPPKTLPHPIMQFVHQYQFLTSDTLNAPLTAEDVILGDKMTAFPGTYATRDFFTTEKKLEQTRGVFLQAVALKYGKGRVVAFTDSTDFSSFCVFLDGYPNFTLGVLEYVNRQNAYEYLNFFFFIAALACFVIAILLLRKEQKTKLLFILATIGILTISLTAPFYTTLNKQNYPSPPLTLRFEKQVCFDAQHQSAIIEPTPLIYQDTMNRGLKTRYTTFFVWTQRIGCTPSVENTLKEATAKGDLVIIINPNKAFTKQDISVLSEYLYKGGKVLLLDTIYNFNSTINDLLSHFNMSIATLNQTQNASLVTVSPVLSSQNNFSVGATDIPYLTINGGRSILKGDENQSMFSVKNWGTGLLAVFVDSSTFSDLTMGDVFTIPSPAVRKIYDFEFYVMEGLLFNENNMKPATMSGYIYRDMNNNSQYDPLIDQPMTRVNISIIKIDNFKNTSFTQFSVSKTTSVNQTGYYEFLTMMPGFYQVYFYNSTNGMLIQQSRAYLSPGNTTQLNYFKG
jgi:hypothetical protein